MNPPSSSPISLLPLDLTSKILSLLPLSSKLACKCVCKSWLAIASSDALLCYTSNLRPTSKPCFLVATKGPYAYALDPAAGLWSRLPKPPYPSATILAASQALACLGNQVSECRTLAVLNLLSKRLTPLPSTRKVGLLHKVAMAVDRETKAYVVVAIGEDSNGWLAGLRRRRQAAAAEGGGARFELLTEVYDSAAEEWRAAAAAPPEAKFGSDPGVWCGGRFYCLTELPYGVAMFDLATGRWAEMEPEMPEGMASASLFCCRGRLFMVGAWMKGRREGGGGESVVVAPPKLASPPPKLASLAPPPPRFPDFYGNRDSDDSDDESGFISVKFIASTASSSRMLVNWPSRSWSWSGPLQSLATSSWSWFSTMSTSWSASNFISPPALAAPAPAPPPAPPPPPPPPPSSSSLHISIWSLSSDLKHWSLFDYMPPSICSQFTSHLALRTPLVCAGVGDYACITSHHSPKAAIFDMMNKSWKLVDSDPVFPRNRDAHLLGFTMEPDGLCIP